MQCFYSAPSTAHLPTFTHNDNFQGYTVARPLAVMDSPETLLELAKTSMNA